MLLTTLLAASALGGLLLLDKWAVGEFALSAPLVSGALFGIAFGDPGTGLLVGVGLQLVWTGSLPLGGEVPPDGQSAGIVAAACALLGRRFAPGSPEQLLFAAFVFGAVTSLVAGYADIANRRVNRFLFERGLAVRSAAALVGLQVLGVTFAFVRGFLVTFALTGLFLLLRPLVARLPDLTRPQLLAIPLSIGLASLAVLFVSRRRIPLVIAGSIVGGLAWVLAR